MVMDREKQRQRYIAGTEGAPPVPPPGGYRNARRQPGAPVAPQPVARDFLPLTASAPEAERPSSSILSRVALGVSILFVLVLLVTMMIGGTDVLYGVTMLALQLVVVALIAAAMLSPRGRMLGGIALVIAVLFNVATVGGIAALQSSATGTYDGMKSDEQKHEEAYPGIKGEDPQTALYQPSVEDIRADADALFTEIREELTATYGYEWVEVGEDDLRPERNGYGGESMLYEYRTAAWATTEPIQDYDRKLEVLDLIDSIVVQHGMYSLYSFNDPVGSNMDPATIAKLYGSEDPRTQHSWESVTSAYDGPMRFYATMTDLSQDPTGSERTAREAQSARTGEPLEGLQLFVMANAVLSDDDREAYEKKLEEYPGYY